MYMPKGVRLLELSPQKIESMWQKLNAINGLFDDYSRGRSDMFINMLQAQDTVWLEREDGNGILYLTQVRPGLSANGHIVYWDRRLRGREQFTLDCMRWLMSEVPLQKINIYLPEFASAAKAFASRLHFKKEGHIRRYSISNGKMFGMDIYGMTIEEAFDERLHGTEDTDIRRTHDGQVEKPTIQPESTPDGSARNGHDTEVDAGHAETSGPAGSESGEADVRDDDGRTGEPTAEHSTASTEAGGRPETEDDKSSDVVWGPSTE